MMAYSAYTVGIYTLGCKVNQYESEAIAEEFLKEGFSLLPPSRPCDVYVINTCTVTAESDRKTGQFIRRAIHKNPSAYILVTGCMAQTQPQRIAAIEGVDYVCGNAEKLSVVDMAKKLIDHGEKQALPLLRVAPPDAFGFEPMEITRFDRTRAYVKIEDGCENHCAYCIIPSARGTICSKRPEDVLREVNCLCRAGCREVVLTGIETGSYGKDLDGYTLADLLSEVDGIEGLERLRLGSLDPSQITQDFAERIAPLKRITPHFHLSMQSGSDRILGLMRRKYNTSMALKAVERLRQVLPSVQFTTDIIVGFPGESEADFEETMHFIEQVGFLMVHVFPYSRRKGTVADRMPEQIAESVKHERVRRLSQRQEEIRARILDGMCGRTVQVLFETFSDGIAVGHTENFVEVACPSREALGGKILSAKLLSHNGERCEGELLTSTESESE